jgi:sulfide:quinone oxidoreductase
MISFDALLVAVGGRPRSPFRRVLAYGTPGSEERMHGLIQDVEAGYVKRIAWIVPPGTSWSLPLYELALMTAERAFDMCAEVEMTLITTEPQTLDILGDAVSDEMARALDAARIAVHVDDEAVIRSSRVLELRRAGKRLQVDRVVTLPILDGPRIAGLPQDEAGFIVADRYGRVDGAPGVYVAGDAAAGSIKQGAIACQQADVVADAILAEAGVETDLRPFAPVLRGEILTGRGARRFVRDLSDGVGQNTQHTWTWSKFAGRELSTLLSTDQSRR